MLSHFNHVQHFLTLRNVAHRAPLSIGFSRQEYWSGLPCPSSGDLADLGIEPRSPALQADALLSEPPGKPIIHNIWGLLNSNASEGKTKGKRKKNVCGCGYMWGAAFLEKWSGRASLRVEHRGMGYQGERGGNSDALMLLRKATGSLWVGLWWWEEGGAREEIGGSRIGRGLSRWH